MSLPGFSAEVSLGNIGRTYRAALGRSGYSEGQTVVAQQWEWWDSNGCGSDCLVQDRNCVATGRSARDCNRGFARCIQRCTAQRV